MLKSKANQRVFFTFSAQDVVAAAAAKKSLLGQVWLESGEGEGGSEAHSALTHAFLSTTQF